MNLRPYLLALAFTGSIAANEAYRLETITLPAAMSPEISAVEFSPTGRLVVANRHGEVWSCDPAKLDWRRYAYGLHEPMGIFVAADNDIYVAQRPELTRVRDANGDGVAEHYEAVNAEWGITDNWHEFLFGPRRDKEGNFVLAIGLPDTAGKFNLTNPRTATDLSKIAREAKPSAALWQGWVFKITPAGKLLPWASGFRQAAGVGVSPEGEVFVTDQQGDYIASSPLIHVQRGRFYGHPASLKWSEELGGRKPTAEELEKMRTPPSVVLPHGSIGGSPGDPVWDTTGGKFGPFAGQVFIGDFTKLISRVDLERVAGEFQGAVFPFLRDATGVEAILKNSGANNLTIPAGGDGKKYFRDAPPLKGTRLGQGNNRLAFAPDGSLYLGQTTRGWAHGDGLQRLVWTGETPVEIRTMRLTERGFALEFTTAMERTALARRENYRVERFRYLYQSASGSPRVDQSEIAVTEVVVSADGRRAELVLSALDPGYIYKLETEPLRAADGRPVANPLAYYTVNRLHSGRAFEGPISKALIAAKPARAREAAPNLEEGRRVYLTFCVACHQADGRGGGIPGFAAADFVGDPTRLAKSDDALLTTIAAGVEGKGMPPFAQVISADERRDVLAFIRQALAAKATRAP
jgi:mono/diheme cytochrome c family protein